jgi:two-component system, OmpR family, alkaline phosphatase synthesis response regulator PhoP
MDDRSMGVPVVGADGASRTVLVADDDDAVRGLIALALARGALAVVQAGDGDEALALARGVRPALAVLDVQMPGRDGIAVCRALKGDLLTAATPVVVLTAETGPEVRERALAAGADAFLTKPSSPAALLALVRDLLPP